MHLTENTNLAVLPIKFASTLYVISNIPPPLIFSNDSETATASNYVAGNIIPGSPNDPAIGERDWTVAAGPVTVVTNSTLDAAGSNCLALALGDIQCLLPTAAANPPKRYRLSVSVHGPAAVGWWNGDIEPLSRRAWDIIGGHNGPFTYNANKTPTALVAPDAFYFP